jgi:hypothetical protein
MLGDAYEASSQDDGFWRIAGGFCRLSPSSDGWYPSQNANKAQYVGLDGSLTEGALDEIIERYRAAGVPRCFYYLHPCAKQEEIEAWLTARSFSFAVEESTLECLTRPRTADPHFEIRVVTPTSRQLIDTLMRGFDADDVSNMTTMLSVPFARTLLAFDEGEPVASGSYLVHGRFAYLGWACTVPEHRKRGAQRALIRERLHLAFREGCEIAASVTYDFAEASFGNLIAEGFTEAFRTPIYRKEF